MTRPRTTPAPDARRDPTPVAARWRALAPVPRGCLLVSAALVASGLVHLGVLVTTGGSWSGPLSWRKPTTFGVSFGLTLATVIWVAGLLPLRARWRDLLLGGFATACVVEVLLITVQAWRGQPSHFGVDAAAAGPVGAAAAGGAAVIVVTMLAATLASLRPMPRTAPSMRLALRAGLASLMVALALGVYMLARGMVLSRGAGDVDGAFAFTAGIKPGHAATMHGVLVLPALAWLLARTGHDEGVRLAIVRAACVGYGVLAGVVVVEVLAGIDPYDPSAAQVPATVLAAVGALVLLGAGLTAVLSWWRHGSTK